MDCSICAHKITKVLHKIVKCPYCSHEACNSCSRQYLLTQPEAHCMSCKKIWPKNFLNTSFDQVFLTSQLEKHYISLFVEDQKKLFPETLEYIENFKYADKINTIRLSIETFQGIAEWVQDNKPHVSFREELVAESFPSLKGLVSKRLMCWKDCTDEVEKLIAVHINKFEEFTGQIKHQFIVQRCITANCIGFLRPNKGQNGKCDICKVVQCLHCLDKIAINNKDVHSCNPQVLQTTKLMLLMYKQCPKCKVFIEKVVGCDQMFCTSCQCAFDWRTGQVILGFFHNPHHDEWVKSGAQARALDCQDIPTLPDDIVLTLRTIFKQLNLTAQPMFLKVYTLIKEQYATNVETLLQYTPQNQYRDLRIQVLEGSMNEFEWKKYIYTYRLSQVRFEDKRQLFMALVVMIRELFEAIVEDLQEIITKFNNPFMFTVKERKLPYPKDLLHPVFTKWELKLIDLIFYFNKHSRETSNDDSYWKIFLPATKFDLSPVYSFSYAPKTNHELPFIMHFPVKFTAEFAKHPILLPEESLLISKIYSDSYTTLETSTALWLEIHLTIDLYKKLNNRLTFINVVRQNFAIEYKSILQAQQEHTCKIMVHSVECTIYPWQAYLLDPTFPTECILKEHYHNIYCVLLDGVKVKNALEVLLLPFTLKESPWTREDIQIINERCENFYHYFLPARQITLTSLSRVSLLTCPTSNNKFLQQMVWLWKTSKIKRKTKFMYEKWTYIFNKIEGSPFVSKSFSSSSTLPTSKHVLIKDNEHVLLHIMLKLIIDLNIILPSDSVCVYLKTNQY